MGKKRTTVKATGAVFMRRSQGNTRNLRGRRSRKSCEPQEESENEEDAGGKDSSSGDEHEASTEVRPKRPKRWGESRSSQASLPSSSADEVETTREMMGGGSSEILAWGRGGMRSHTRHGSLSNSAGKSTRNTRVSKLMNHLRKLPQTNDKVTVNHIVESYVGVWDCIFYKYVFKKVRLK